MKFILQSREVPYDFELELLRAQEFYYWRSEGTDKTRIEIYRDIDPLPLDFMELCPVGSVEFVVSWLSDIHSKTPMPINVPPWMFIPWCGRGITNLEFPIDPKIYFPWSKEVFIKSMGRIKHGINGKYDITDGIFSSLSGQFQVSDYINPEDIVSEWRVFVYRGSVLDIRCYSGDPWKIPEKFEILELVEQYTHHEAPVAYTLDVIIVGEVMEVVEVHDFFSCGLYGFSDLYHYPRMLYSWFKEFIGKDEKV